MPQPILRRTHDPETALLASVVGMFVLAILCLWCASITGQAFGYEALPINPITVLSSGVKGELVWHTAYSLGAAIPIIIAILAAAIWQISHSSRANEKIAEADRVLADSSTVGSLSAHVAKKRAVAWGAGGYIDTHPGFMFARRGRQSLWGSWEDNYLVIFGPRMGKTTTLVIPAVLEAPGSVVTTSNKPDIVQLTAGKRSALGPVWVFDPDDITTSSDIPTWYFDPLDYVRRSPAHMDAAAASLAGIFLTATRGSSATGSSNYWSVMGKELLGYMMLAAAVDHAPISVVFEWVNNPQDETCIDILSGHTEWAHVADALRGVYHLVEETRSGVFSQAAQMASPLGRRAIRQWITPHAGARRFDANAFVRSTNQTLYVLSSDNQDNAAAVTTALTALVMKAAEEYGQQKGGRLPVPLMVALDEAANVVKWPELPQLYSHYGSRSIVLMTVLQSYAQGERVWGQDGMEALWSTASFLLYGGGVRDRGMLERLEVLIGHTDVFDTSVSYSSHGRSTTESRREQKILSAADLACFPRGKIAVFSASRPALIAETVHHSKRA